MPRCARQLRLWSGERGVLMLEVGGPELAGGNTKYSAGALRFSHDGMADIMPLLRDLDDPRLKKTDFGSYPVERFANDLLRCNEGLAQSAEQETLVADSLGAIQWLASHDVRFEPIYSGQSFERDGRHVFWGGLALAARDEGVGLFDMELETVLQQEGSIRYDSAFTGLLRNDSRVVGVSVGGEKLLSDAVILACGGFEACSEWRVKYLGRNGPGPGYGEHRTTRETASGWLSMRELRGTGITVGAMKCPWTCTWRTSEDCTCRRSSESTTAGSRISLAS